MKDFDWEFPPWWAVPFMWLGGVMALSLAVGFVLWMLGEAMSV